jgi:hypothetical protein
MNLFLALLIKHFIVDIGVQSLIPATPKHNYFSGHLHYFHHGVGAFLATMFVVPIQYAMLIGVLDYIAHWHIDWAKHHLNIILEAKPRSEVWWWTMVLDQIVHVLFYYTVALHFSVQLAA